MLLGLRSAVRRGTARFRTVRSMEYSMQGSAITASPIHSRRRARGGGVASMTSPFRAGIDVFCWIVERPCPRSTSPATGAMAKPGRTGGAGEPVAAPSTLAHLGEADPGVEPGAILLGPAF